MATYALRSTTKLGTQANHSLLIPVKTQTNMNKGHEMIEFDSEDQQQRTMKDEIAGHELDDQAKDMIDHERNDTTKKANSQIVSESLKEGFGHELDDQNSTQGTVSAKTQRSQFVDASQMESIVKFDGISDPAEWLEYIMCEFDAWKLTMNQKNEIIPEILTGKAFIWYANHHKQMPNFFSFAQELIRSFSNTTTHFLEAKPVLSLPTQIKSRHSSETETSLANALRTQMIVANLEKFPKYAGKAKQNVTKWLTEIQQSMHLLKLTDEEKLSMIPTCLEAEASDWYFDNLKLFPTWMSFIRELKQTFESSSKQDIAFNRLRHYEQSTNQGVRQYYFDIMKLCKEANPDMNATIKLQYLKDGLKSSLRFQVLLHNPRTPEEFLQYAQKVEELKSLDEKQATAEGRVENNQTVTIPISSNKNNNHTPSHTEQQQQQQLPPRQMLNGVHTRTPYRNTHQYNTWRETSQIPRENYQFSYKPSTVVCYRCHEPGHIVPQCPYFQ